MAARGDKPGRERVNSERRCVYDDGEEVKAGGGREVREQEKGAGGSGA